MFFSIGTVALCAGCNIYDSWAAVLVGVVFYSYFSLYKGNEILGTTFHWLHVAGMNFVLIVAVMLIITVVKPRESAWEQPYSEDVDITPWKFAVPAGELILVAIAVMYWTMSRLG